MKCGSQFHYIYKQITLYGDVCSHEPLPILTLLNFSRGQKSQNTYSWQPYSRHTNRLTQSSCILYLFSETFSWPNLPIKLLRTTNYLQLGLTCQHNSVNHLSHSHIRNHWTSDFIIPHINWTCCWLKLVTHLKWLAFSFAVWRESCQLLPRIVTIIKLKNMQTKNAL